MNRSPGHRKWPDHQVREQRLQQRMQASVAGEVIAESNDVIRVDEDGSPPRYYFPRTDVRMDKLTPTDTQSECPFKGIAHYFSLSIPGRELEDAVWTYEDPYEEHSALRQRLAFYEEKVPEIEVRPA